MGYRTHNGTNPKYSEKVYQHKRLHLRIMGEHRCHLKDYEKDLCYQLQNCKYQGYLIILDINGNRDTGTGNFGGRLK